MIAILSTKPGPGHGAEIVLSELLHAWSDGGEPLTVLAPADSAVHQAAKTAGHRFAPLDATRDTIVANWRAAGKAARPLAGVRIVHAWAARGFEGAAHIAARLGVSCTGTLHDHPAAAFHGRLRRTVMKCAASRFDALACVSEAVHNACRNAGYHCPLAVIHNGLADVEPAPDAKVSDAVRVGFLGMYARMKGFDIIRAWIEALQHEPVEWRLYGTVSPELAPAAAELEARFGPRVQVRGRRPSAEIFSEIDLLAHASTGFDSLPTVLIEAARAGIPSVACAHGGAGEIVVAGETGFLFPPTQPDLGLKYLRELITDIRLRSRQAEAARARFETDFGVARMVGDYASFWSRNGSMHHAAK